jgi:hypothetical protein
MTNANYDVLNAHIWARICSKHDTEIIQKFQACGQTTSKKITQAVLNKQ